MRIGHGYDVHRLVSGRALILGGVTIPYEKGLDGHSDADVLVHAVMDALLGAAALCGGYLLYASAQARCDWPAGSEDLANITHGLKNAYTMMGALLGFLIVYFADEKKLRFDVHAPFWGQVLKLVLGLALIVAIKAGLKPLLVTLFAGSQAESFVRYFVIVIFAGIVWPLTFPFFANIGKKGKAA